MTSTIAMTVTTADAMRTYLAEIGRIPLLTAEQEVALARRIEAGRLAAERLAAAEVPAGSRAELEATVADARRAREHMLEANLRLVVSIARRYTGRGLALLDLVQEGNLGLIRAVERFDHHRGFRFSTYATWWIKQAVGRALADQSRTIRVPVHMAEVINRVTRTRRELAQELNREPTRAEIAAATGLTPERVAEVQRYDLDPVSLHTPVGEDGGAELGDLIEDTGTPEPLQAISHGLLREQLRKVLAGLSEREAGVIALRYGLGDGEPRTLDQIGRIHGVTRERIRQIEAKTMGKLRQASRTRLLEGFLG